MEQYDKHILPVALTIAGSDSGAGAGIQADLKTFTANGIYGCSVITMITAQSTIAVDMVELLPESWVQAQLETVFDDFQIKAIKTGALGCIETIESVVSFLASRTTLPLVIDPVMISKHGHALLSPDAVNVLKCTLFPLAHVITPNLHEAAALVGCSPITSRDGMLDAAQQLLSTGCHAVLIKGGHLIGTAADLLLCSNGAEWFEGERVATAHTHGTGCTFSAAITAGLVKGSALSIAVRHAKEYITGALQHGQRFGHGISPVNHFWRTMPRFGDGNTA